MKSDLVITIDGPAGVGKSSVSKALAARLSYLYLDTGALYRALAYKMMAEGIDPADEALLSPFLERTEVRFDNSSDIRVFVGQEDVTEKIRTEEIGLLASTISAIPSVRKALLQIQRKTASSGRIVAEGRDTGTVVFPNADVKFFLEASMNERIRRRYEELLWRGVAVDYQTIAEGMAIRDKQDCERPIAPLKAHPEAVLINTTEVSVPEVVDRMMEVIRCHLDTV